jgi:ATP-dependent Clp protease ATP-binding subunit ClpA
MRFTTGLVFAIALSFPIQVFAAPTALLESAAGKALEKQLSQLLGTRFDALSEVHRTYLLNNLEGLDIRFNREFGGKGESNNSFLKLKKLGAKHREFLTNELSGLQLEIRTVQQKLEDEAKGLSELDLDDEPIQAVGQSFLSGGALKGGQVVTSSRGEPTAITYDEGKSVTLHLLPLPLENGASGKFVLQIAQPDGSRFVVGTLTREDYSTSVSDGILSIEGLHRRIDLRELHAESKFVPRESKAIKNAADSGQSRMPGVDAVGAVEERYRNLTREYLQHPTAFSPIDPNVLKQVRKAIEKRDIRGIALLGPAGAGKSETVSSLVAMIARGEVAGIPRTWSVLEVNAASLMAGNNLVGESEQRLAEIMAACREKPYILFMDEIHSMASVGGKGAGSGEANTFFQTLKPAMARGEIFVLGASTEREFSEAFASDQALYQRFIQVPLVPPSDDKLMNVLETWISRHGLPPIDRSVLDRVVGLSNEFDSLSAQPRRSTRLLDDLYAELAVDGRRAASPTVADVENAAATLYQMDRAMLDPALRRERLQKLVTQLDEIIIGQDDAKRALVEAATISLAGAHDPKRPRLALLFAGPRGVGKTELAKEFAKALGLPFKIIEMGQYTGEHSPAELASEVGSALRINGQTVIILDEFEKASPQAQNALLSALQEGEFSVGKAKQAVSSRNASFIITTNAAQARIVAHPGLSDSLLREALRADGVSEFLLDRVNQVVAFPPFDRLTRPRDFRSG